MLTFARAHGISVFDALAMDVVSMPMTVMAVAQESLHHRAGTDLLHTVEHAGLRGHQSGPRSTSAAVPSYKPATATLPSSSCRVASNRTSALSASGTTRPYSPECRP